MLMKVEDCRGRCVCYADPMSGMVEFKNRDIKTSVVVEVGKSFIIKRQNTITSLTRVREDHFERISKIIE